MAVRLEEQPAFRRGSPVLAYWLAHSEGFRLRSRLGYAVVEGVYVEPPGRVTALAVRSRLLRRRRLVPASAVEEVVPHEQLLLAARPVRVRERAAATTRVALRAGDRTAVGLRLAARRTEPHARRLGVLALAALARAAAAALAVARAGGRRFARAVDGNARRRWSSTVDRAAGKGMNAISRSSSFAVSAAAAGCAAATARLRAGSSPQPQSPSLLPEPAPPSSEPPQRPA